VIDAHNITEVYGPTLVYARSAAQSQAEHARPDQDAKEWLDEQVGSIIKWPVPVSSVTRIEWLSHVSSDMFLVGAVSHLTAAESRDIHALAQRGVPIALLGSPAGGFDPSLRDLLGLESDDARSSPPSTIKARVSSFGASLALGVPENFPVRQGFTKNTAAPNVKPVYFVADSPTLVLNQSRELHLMTWDPPEFAVEWDTRLLDIWRGSTAPYVLAASAANALLANSGSLHASAIDSNQTVNLMAWRTADGRAHLMFGNLEEGLSDDADLSRKVTIELPVKWGNHPWSSVWTGATFNQQDNSIHVDLEQAHSAQLVSPRRDAGPF
jgi:hypothetical protein